VTEPQPHSAVHSLRRQTRLLLHQLLLPSRGDEVAAVRNVAGLGLGDGLDDGGCWGGHADSSHTLLAFVLPADMRRDVLEEVAQRAIQEVLHRNVSRCCLSAFLRIDLDRILDLLEQEWEIDDYVPLVVITIDRVEHVFARRLLVSRDVGDQKVEVGFSQPKEFVGIFALEPQVAVIDDDHDQDANPKWIELITRRASIGFCWCQRCTRRRAEAISVADLPWVRAYQTAA